MSSSSLISSEPASEADGDSEQPRSEPSRTDKRLLIGSALGAFVLLIALGSWIILVFGNSSAFTGTIDSETARSSLVGPAEIEMQRCDASGESLELLNVGGEIITLDGWVLRSDEGDTGADLSVITLEPGEAVRVLSGDSHEQTTDGLWWTNRDVWDDEGETATLLRPNGIVEDRLACY